ncbi:RdgB/HAM1 family non-canonical purine NTP pyrophosphatase [Naumannella halotolerans]|uniref:RdgB/HAM1 family non-canonical purine NTP pyrophosphatase n=1 Tax=Naumannella halotolerans TaxID=993414 RepID=UPI00370DCC57
MSRLVLASHNAKKLQELQRILGGQGIEVVGLNTLTDAEPPAETGSTFEQNALIKARAASRETGLPALADDSGISVDVLNGMPGVRSARWYGPDATDVDNVELLLRQLADVEPERRGAHFVCALAFVRPNEDGEVAEDVVLGEVSGRLTEQPSGRHGFGYDPIFVADGHTMTMAELTPAEKDQISHRGRALELMAPLVVADLTRE